MPISLNCWLTLSSCILPGHLPGSFIIIPAGDICVFRGNKKKKKQERQTVCSRFVILRVAAKPLLWLYLQCVDAKCTAMITLAVRMWDLWDCSSHSWHTKRKTAARVSRAAEVSSICTNKSRNKAERRGRTQTVRPRGEGKKKQHEAL